MAKRRQDEPAMPLDEARAELDRIAAEDEALIAQWREIARRRQELQNRRLEIEEMLIRAQVSAAVGEYVVINAHVRDMRRREPKPGDVGRLLKIGRTRALIDFGDQLRTWYVPLRAVGEVKDPFADDTPADDE